MIITTKSGSALKGRKGQEVTAKSSVSFENIANLPDYQNEFGAGSQLRIFKLKRFMGTSLSVTVIQFLLGLITKTAYPELFPSDSVAYRAYPEQRKRSFQNRYGL